MRVAIELKSFRRGLFAVASFMLALIGLKKFRSFQESNRIDVLERKLLLPILHQDCSSRKA